MLTEYAAKVFSSFERLSKILEREGDDLVIYDEPLRIVIKKDRIEFYVDDEFHGFVDRKMEKLSEEVKFEAEMWLRALANLQFKRFSLRK